MDKTDLFVSVETQTIAKEIKKVNSNNSISTLVSDYYGPTYYKKYTKIT